MNNIDYIAMRKNIAELVATLEPERTIRETDYYASLPNELKQQVNQTVFNELWAKALINLNQSSQSNTF